MARHNELGKRGEKLAFEMLKNIGYTILETNWRHEKEEIDIIAQDGDELVITEVKTRSTDYFGNPEEAVNAAKANRMIQAAEAYVEEHDLNIDIRYDIIAVIIDKNVNINHIKNAFYAGDF